MITKFKKSTDCYLFHVDNHFYQLWTDGLIAVLEDDYMSGFRMRYDSDVKRGFNFFTI